MMHLRTALLHEPIAICAPYKTIEQPIPVNVAQLFPATKKTDSAKTMHAEGYSRKPLHIFLDGADRAQAARMQQRR